MGDPLRVLLLGNYLPDRQESMQRFSSVLNTGLTAHGIDVRVARPAVSFAQSGSLGGKWVGYLDKFSRFRAALSGLVSWAEVVHICDHSNAMYCGWITDRPTVVTCHDLLAVRGARGENTDCPASRTGRVLQKWIVAGLKHANLIAAVSSYTMSDVQHIVGSGPRLRLALNGLNHPYRPLSVEEARARLADIPDLGQRPFIINVGSNLPRKNRAGALRVFAKARQYGDFEMLMVGHGLSPELAALATTLGVREHVRELPNVDNGRLEALYNLSHALLFPSRFEGFGWPIIEAQASGCPVVCSDCGPFPEVAGPDALLRALHDEDGMAKDLQMLLDPAQRRAVVANGLKNSERFTMKRMIDDYVSIYHELAGRT